MHRPQFLRDGPAPSWSYPRATVSSGAYAVLLTYLQPLTLQGVSTEVWTYPEPQMLLQHGLFLRQQSLQGCALLCGPICNHRCCPAPRWTYPQVSGPSTQVHTGVPTCPVQHHRNRSNVLATFQLRCMSTAVIKMFRGTAE